MRKLSKEHNEYLTRKRENDSARSDGKTLQGVMKRLRKEREKDRVKIAKKTMREVRSEKNPNEKREEN
jgi:hypothetical protein